MAFEELSGSSDTGPSVGPASPLQQATSSDDVPTTSAKRTTECSVPGESEEHCSSEPWPSGADQDTDPPPNDDGKPIRARPIAVCLQCHSRRVRCDRIWPCCLSCKLRGQKCTWDSRLYGPEGPDLVKIAKLGRRRRRDKNAKTKRENGSQSQEDDGVLASVFSECAVAHREAPENSSRCTDTTRMMMPPLARTTFSTAVSSFLISVSRVAPMNAVMSFPPCPNADLPFMYDLWKAYVDAGMEGDDAIVAHGGSVVQRQGLYNAFCAVVVFAHGATYVNYHTAESIAVALARVAVKLLASVIASLDAHPTDPLTPSLVAGFLIFLRVRDIALPADVQRAEDLYAELGGLLERRGLTGFEIGYDNVIADLPGLIIVCDLIGKRAGIMEVLAKSAALRAMWLADSEGLVAHHDHWRSALMVTMFTFNVLFSFVLAQCGHGTMDAVFHSTPFTAIPPPLQEICIALRDDLAMFVELWELHSHTVDHASYPEMYIANYSLYPYLLYSRVYTGLLHPNGSEEMDVSNLLLTMNLQCRNPTVHVHPLNTPSYMGVAYGLAVLVGCTGTPEVLLEALEGIFGKGFLFDRSLPSVLSKKGQAMLEVCKQLVVSTESSLVVLPRKEEIF